MNKRQLMIALLSLTSGMALAQVQEVEHVSLINLIATPKAFDGKRIRVVGFVRIEFEGNAIYLHADDLRNGNTKNGLWLDLPRPLSRTTKVNDQYAIVEGVFSMEDQGHFGLWSGAITQITRLDAWRPKPSAHTTPRRPK